MQVESEPGRGSTFSFTVQLARSSEPLPVDDELEIDPLRGKRVLIVDDNETNLRLLRLQTIGFGMEPVVEHSPRQALQRLAQGERFDLAILDMLMPEMDGIELAHEIGARMAKEAPPLLLLSSVSRPELDELRTEGVENAEDLFSAILTKPVRQRALHQALRQACGAAPLARSATAPEIEHGLAGRAPLRILLAEDNSVNQKVALAALARMGYRVEVAANGIEALEALARQPFDVVLMDVQMPELDGIGATRAIRGRGEREAQPWIIAMTAHALKGDHEACLAAGMDDYLSKPVRARDLANKLLAAHAALAAGPRPRA
jgi:CheY-like chemotaxis protein